MNEKICCVKCKRAITGAHYNTPIGKYCIQCWDKVSQRTKARLERQALEWLATKSKRLFD